MCEFKIIKQNDGLQILEDIVVLTYTDNNELLFKDILGMGESLESALIMSVNTLNQKCEVLEHPIIKDFMKLLKKISTNELTNFDIEEFSNELIKLKS
jgi:hypothetical protein